MNGHLREDYRNAVDGLTFSADFTERTTALLQARVRQEKEEPMKFKRSRKTIALLAAAVALLVVSVSAANLDTLKEIVWELQTVFFVSGETEDGSFAAIRIPEVTLADRGERVILTVEGEETDVTDALAAEQVYTLEQAEEDGRLVIEVTGTPEDCQCTVSGYGTGTAEPLFTVTYRKNQPHAEGDVAYSAPNGETVVSDETVVIGGSAYSDTETITVTNGEEFEIGPYDGGEIYGLDTDDPLT